MCFENLVSMLTSKQRKKENVIQREGVGCTCRTKYNDCKDRA